MAVYQTYIGQKKTDEVNSLTLELQKKSMAMAEQAYKSDVENIAVKVAPEFELINCMRFC